MDGKEPLTPSWEDMLSSSHDEDAHDVGSRECQVNLCKFLFSRPCNTLNPKPKHAHKPVVILKPLMQPFQDLPRTP